MSKFLTILRGIATTGVSGSLVYAALVQWASVWLWVEVISNFRPLVLPFAVAGTLLFLLGLSLGRVLIGTAVCVWLAWPMAPLFFPKAADAPPDAERAPGEWTLARVSLAGIEDVEPVFAELWKWQADVVVVAGITRSQYVEHFPAMRAAGYGPQHAAPAQDGTGLWVFTKRAVGRDKCQTMTRKLGRPAVDWTLDTGGPKPARLLVAQAPFSLRSEAMDERAKVFAALHEAATLEETKHTALVLCGGLWATPDSRLRRNLAAATKLQDPARGRGWHPTWRLWPGLLPDAVGLDFHQILPSHDWQVLDHRVFWWQDGRENGQWLRLRPQPPEVS